MDAFNLDIRTMAAMASLAGVMQAVALSILWRTVPQAAGPAHWAAGGVLLAAGMLLIAFRSLIPDLFSIVLANTLIAGSHASFLIGIQNYLGLRASIRSCAIVIGATVGVFIAFTYLYPDIANRVVAISLALSVLSAACAFQFFRRPRMNLAMVEWLLVGVFVCHALFHVVRGTYSAFADHGLDNFMNASIVHGVAFVDIVIFCFIVAIGFSVSTVLAMNDVLQSELESRSTMLSIIAHDVRTPFSGLVGATHLIRANIALNKYEDVARFAELLSQEAEMALRLLEDLITWGKAQFSDARATNSIVNLESLVGDIFLSFQTPATAKQVSVTTDLTVREVLADKDIVAMALRNFLSNAIKFSPENGIIAISSRGTSTGVSVTVSDSGTGLDPAVAQDGALTAEQLASRALTDAPAGRGEGQSGMGIGLSLCARTCKRHGYGLTLATGKTGGVTAQLIIPQT